MASPPTLFKLQPLTTPVGPVALVTMDNGEDWQKPNTFGEGALRSLEEVLDRLESGDWQGMVLTGKPFVFAVGAQQQGPDPSLREHGQGRFGSAYGLVVGEFLLVVGDDVVVAFDDEVA